MIMANWALVILTLGLLIVTIIYAVYTRKLADDTKRMADIMVQEFELRIAPFIVIDQLPSTRGTNVREYHPMITNKGFLTVHIMKIILEGWSKGTPSKIFRKERKIDKFLGRNESIPYGQFVIQLRKNDVPIDTLEEGKGSDFNQFLDSSQGKIYFTYVDRDEKEQRTRDHYLEHL
jgi:hypothetical protein